MGNTPRHTALLQREGQRIEVVVDGERGTPLVMLPSSLRDARDFDLAAQQLAAAGFQVLRPAPRGMGASTGPLEGLTLHTLADDVVFAVQQIARAPAILVGHAFGHFVARVADLDHPQWVRGVAVVGAAARSFPPGMAESLAIASDPAQADEERLRHLRRAFFAPGNDPSSWLDGWYPELRAAYRAAGAVPDKSVWWPVHHAPLLDLQGADDPWRPPATRDELRQALGDAVTVRVIQQASHALVVEQPAAVAQAIAEWAATLPR